MWPLTQKRSLWTNARHANARQANGLEMDSQAIRNGAAEWMNRRRKFLNEWCRADDENFGTDEVAEWKNGWRKFLNGWGRTDERLKKNFEQLAVMCWVFLASMSWSKFTAWGTYSMHFMRSRKAFECSRKNYNRVVKNNWLIRLQLA